MTDLEMTKLCAAAMGFPVRSWGDDDTFIDGDEPPESAVPTTNWDNAIYDPLHDDAQAMALVKKCDLSIHRHKDYSVDSDSSWRVDAGYLSEMVVDHDLNRAIVECVAKMQGAK